MFFQYIISQSLGKQTSIIRLGLLGSGMTVDKNMNFDVHIHGDRL
jgi:hypothetical protein